MASFPKVFPWSFVFDDEIPLTVIEDGTLELITDHDAQGKGLLIEQYKPKPRINALLGVYRTQIQ